MFLEGSTLEVRLGREELRLSLLGKKGERLLSSAAAWEPHEIDGVETYTLLMIWPGIRALFKDLSEAYRRDAFVWASRIRARDLREYLTVQTKHYLRIWLGDKLFEKIKRL